VVRAWFCGVTGTKEGGVGDLDKSHPWIGCPGRKVEGGLKEEVSLEQGVNDEGLEVLCEGISRKRNNVAGLEIDEVVVGCAKLGLRALNDKW